MECSDQPGPIREGEALPITLLEEYLRDHLELANDPLTVEQFPAGYSNLTYLLRIGPDEFVLRRPPYGNLVKNAHDMEREYLVLSKLWNCYAPAPKPLAYCDNESVIGAPFYLMERIKGVIVRKTAPGSLKSAPTLVRRLCESFVDNFAQLHSLDLEAVGLVDLGRPEGFIERQVLGWSRRYQKAKTEELPAMDHVADWLACNMPAESGATLIHNDYKHDNLILDPGNLTRIIGVLDWEMATLGDPLMDLGVTLSYWVEATDSKAARETVFSPTTLPGSYTRRELIQRYQEKTGREIANVQFYFCYGIFKLAVIVQQIYARYQRGHTQDTRFARLNEMVRSLSQRAVLAMDPESI